MSVRYVLNDTVAITMTFAGDPATVSLDVISPSGTTTTYTYSGGDIIRESSGVYVYGATADEVGVWSYVAEGTGTFAAVQDGTFTVYALAPQSPAYYCTLDELKASVFSGGVTADSEDDVLLTQAIESSSRWIDEYCQRPMGFGQTTATRVFTPHSSWCLEVDDLVTVTTLKTSTANDGTYDTTWSAVTDYQLTSGGEINTSRYGVTWPYDRIDITGTRSFPIFTYGIRQSVQIAGTFGWPAIPPGVREACKLEAAKAFRRKDSIEGILGGFADGGIARVGTRIDPSTERWLAPYRNLRGSLVG